MIKIGDVIEILYMKDMPKYVGRIGTVEMIDDLGNLHGTWGGLAVIPSEDEFRIVTMNMES